MTTEEQPKQLDYRRRAIEIAIHLVLVILLTTACLMILRPFLPMVAWGIIIAIAVNPAYQKLRSLLGGRGKLAAVIFTLLFLGVLIVPVAMLTETMIQGFQTLIAHTREGTLGIPTPPESVRTWPLVGGPLYSTWDKASSNLTEALKSVAPQLRALVPGLLHASAGIGMTVVEFVLSILVAGVLLANASGGAVVSHSLASRLFGDRGPEFETLAGSTIRSVTNGILGVAVIQSVLAGVGFLTARLPGAGLWTLVFLFAAVLQAGGLVLLPAVIYMFAVASTTKAVLFLLWCILVSVVEHALKPLLLGRGVAVPIVVIFLGAIGGFLAVGIIGLFVGAIVLCIGYKLFLAWLEGPVAAKEM